MNKFQKIAFKIAANDYNNGIIKCKMPRHARSYYLMFKSNKTSWPLEKCRDFKNWSYQINKTIGSVKNNE